MKTKIPEELQEHLLITNKKGFYALYSFREDILYTIDYFDGEKFKCWLQMHLSGPEVGWQSYGDARIASPLVYNVINFFKDALQITDAETFFFYLGE